MAICNVVGSTITREVGRKTPSTPMPGPEIAVASTKAYITQAELMVMLAVALADLRGQSPPERAAQLMEGLADSAPQGRTGAGRGRTAPAHRQHGQPEADMCSSWDAGMDYALSMEAALKLKEVSYIFSEAYAAGRTASTALSLCCRRAGWWWRRITQPAA